MNDWVVTWMFPDEITSTTPVARSSVPRVFKERIKLTENVKDSLTVFI